MGVQVIHVFVGEEEARVERMFVANSHSFS